MVVLVLVIFNTLCCLFCPLPLPVLLGLLKFFFFPYPQVDESTYDGDGGSSELPDGLANFRMSLAELFLEICHFLGPATYIQKVLEMSKIFMCTLVVMVTSKCCYCFVLALICNLQLL